MKFRIKEVTRKFYPQYKTFIFWHNISEDYFVRTIFNKNKTLTENNSYVYSLEEARDIIKDFKAYYNCQEQYVKIYKVD